ncbi:MAG: hypothetical protein J0M04_21995 [Verrucomicrobia bacterium]|nr:hypothetical protein [Verrucomicrobiota bacterium]
MSTVPSNAITAGLVGAGALVWMLSARPAVTNPDLAAPLNPMGINRSPYGEVFAMAMQSPIDAYWHGSGAEGDHHDHDHDHETEHAVPAASLRDRFVAFLSELDHGVNERTNPKPVTAAHGFYMRRQTEDKLRFAYQLDPSHYGNFNSYYFFLTQPYLGTRPELTPSAVMLAKNTIDYCLSQEDDPRPALTAAAAAENILEMMITDYRNGNRQNSVKQMREMLALLDRCIARYDQLAAGWDASGAWNRLSEFRLTEVRERLRFVLKLRQDEAIAIENLGKLPTIQQVSK